MELVLATGNTHKKEELERILGSHSILLPAEIGVAFEAEETGATYLDNALIKARALFASSGGRAVLADDSGLSVPALGGAPGVFSARYGSEGAGRELEAADRNALLLKNMTHLKDAERRAFFVCCMVLMVDEYRVFSAQETFGGLISEAPAGVGGFGYDPIFFVPQRGCTVAELQAAEKDGISHRGRAGRRIAAFLDSLAAVP